MNYSSKIKGKPPKYSDHNSIILDIDMKVKKHVPERKIIYNFRDMEAMTKFKAVTTTDSSMMKCLETNETLDQQSRNWQKTLEKLIQKTFKKIRINKPIKAENDRMKNLFNKRKTAILNKELNTQDVTEDKIKRKEAMEDK